MRKGLGSHIYTHMKFNIFIFAFRKYKLNGWSVRYHWRGLHQLICWKSVRFLLSESDCWKSEGQCGKTVPKESVEGADTVLRAVWGLPRDFPRANPRLQKRGGAAPEVLKPRVCPRKIPRESSHWSKAHCWHPRHSPAGTVIPLCPNDFQQLLRLPKSWGLLANEARRLDFLMEFTTNFFLLWYVILDNFLWRTLK